MRLENHRHDRDAAGLTYVYPVVSRRAGGVSVGINLNVNNACNWRCVYCQVPGLVYGKGPEIDLELLERELEGMLRRTLEPSWMQRTVPEGSRRLNDVAFSGNGEPTSSPQFAGAVERAVRVLERLGLEGRVPIVLITNGSLVQHAEVQRGLERMATSGGQVWFKLDSATAEGQARIQSNAAGVDRTRRNLATAARLCPTWLQTCMFRWNGQQPSPEEQGAYLDFLTELRGLEPSILGVLLYGLARPSHQPEAAELEALDEAWLRSFAERIERTGTPVRVTP
jgi:wyosine [tRNA(Phe)-imidazoG37] synthetase (radical SAM superfamily)